MSKKKILIILFTATIVFFFSYSSSYSWGFYAHKRINKFAVFTLPPQMIGFYKQHLDFIIEHSVDPDKRRYSIDDEAQRHYIDIDHYAIEGENYFDSIPKIWKDVVNKYSEDSVNKYGIVPWHIETMVSRLTFAFKEERADRILQVSAELGHYIGDAHVPLHTTKNYNGQLTNQKGIHGFWESRLPELYAKDYDNLVGRAYYIDNINDKIWSIIKVSFSAIDSVLNFEAELNKTVSSDRKYSFENRGNNIVKVYSQEYSKSYDLLLNGMVERRFRDAVLNIGSLWYTAWVNAGQPDLTRLDNPEVIQEMKQKIKNQEKLWNTGKISSSGCYDD